MSHLDVEIKQLKNEIIQMIQLVEAQCLESKNALINYDREAIDRVFLNEENVNRFELKIDRKCENLLALFNPVAIDLRFILAMLKTGYNLERIGDYIEGATRHIIYLNGTFKKNLLTKTRLLVMYDTVHEMLLDIRKSLEEEAVKPAQKVFEKDNILDDINLKGYTIIEEYIKKNIQEIRQSLYVFSIIRKFERVGDLIQNIAEDIIFYLEAKILKHHKK